MTSKRSYNEYCGLAKALDVVGERWTLLIVRNLLLGPLRYSDLLRGLPGITTNLLAKRLKEMEENGLVERIRSGPAESGHAYRLTDLGTGLEPAILALGRWGAHRMAGPSPGEHRDLEWLLVSLKRRYRGGVTLSAELVADDAPYRLVLSPGGVEIRRGSQPRPELRVRGPAQEVARLFLEGVPADGPAAELRVDGGGELLRRLVGAFERPGG